MEINMVSDEMMLDSNRFVMLDLENTRNENETTKGYPIVQIVDPSNINSFHNIEVIKSRVERMIKFEEKREHLFKITLNIDEDYKNQLFR
jgi:hypothetical protein